MVEGLTLPSIASYIRPLNEYVKKNGQAPARIERDNGILVSQIISEERLTKYLVASGYNTKRALDLYGWNIQISEAFFPVLGASEVCLRNTVSARLLDLYGPTWWDDATFLAQIKNGKRIVKTASENLKRKGPVTSGGMTAELNFGLWAKMLLPKHEKVFWTDLHNSFPDLPPHVTYTNLYQRCDDVREFRNRVFHHEPILERDISQEYSQIVELIKWISPKKAKWIKQYSRVMTVLRQKP